MYYLRIVLASTAALALAISTEMAIADGQGLYRITTLRAAPGQWVDLKSLIEERGEAGTVSSDGRSIPYRIRHSQGAQWDFMLIQPIDDFGDYFGEDKQRLEARFRAEIEKLADFAEDWFAAGPSHSAVHAAYPDTGMFHVEMFRARAGMKDALYDSRVRENRVLEAIELKSNFIFIGEFGADWDVVTIGFHESLVSYATAGGGVSVDTQDQAAREHGFDGMGDLAPQLRALLTQHSDTIATAMN